MQGGTLCLGSVSLACHSGHGVIALYVTKTFGYYVPKILGQPDFVHPFDRYAYNFEGGITFGKTDRWMNGCRMVTN